MNNTHISPFLDKALKEVDLNKYSALVNYEAPNEEQIIKDFEFLDEYVRSLGIAHFSGYRFITMDEYDYYISSSFEGIYIDRKVKKSGMMSGYEPFSIEKLKGKNHKKILIALHPYLTEFLRLLEKKISKIYEE